MTHDHSHSHGENQTGRNLIITMSLNFIITIAEVTGGILSGSLSLISDAMHNFSDGIAIILTYTAMRMSTRPRTLKYTFGLKRAEVIAAIINSSTLIIISVFLIKEAIERFNNPAPIVGKLMLAVASVGLLANVSGTLLLKKSSEDNINIRAAYFHLLSDAVSSMAVILGAIAIIFFKIYWVDTVLTILISLYIIKETFDILKESVDMIMMATPEEIDLEEVQSLVQKIPGILSMHHIHVYRINDNDTHLEAHVDVEDMPVSDTDNLYEHIQQILHENFEINHVTIQFECDRCKNKGVVYNEQDK